MKSQAARGSLSPPSSVTNTLDVANLNSDIVALNSRLSSEPTTMPRSSTRLPCLTPLGSESVPVLLPPSTSGSVSISTDRPETF